MSAPLPDALSRIHDHKINRLDEPLPWNWKLKARLMGEAA